MFKEQQCMISLHKKCPDTLKEGVYIDQQYQSEKIQESLFEKVSRIEI